MEIFNFLTDDWKKIPQNYRFLILMGAFLIFNSWFIDHWGSKNIYLFWGYDIRYVGYSLGLSIILLALLVIVVKQFLYFKKLLTYRLKYQLSKLDKDFHLIWFGRGKLYIFDNNEDKYYHVYPWETAEDLLFVGRGDHFSTSEFPVEPKPKVPLQDGTTLDTSKYKSGGAINTRS